jgi:hypothetical protein
MILRYYIVTKVWPSIDEERPFCITRMEIDDEHKVSRYVIADHPIYDMALYWVTMLSNGRVTEEQVKEQVKQGGVGSATA